MTEMKWHRTVGDRGNKVVTYTLGDTGYRIEGVPELSHHVGMVFGVYLDEAYRIPRIREWTMYLPNGNRGWAGKLAACKAQAERRMLAEEQS